MQRRTLIKIAVLLLLAGAVIAIWFSPLRAYLTREHIRAFVEHLRGLWYGPLAFIAVFALGCVLALPASVFVIAAGFIWGWLLGHWALASHRVHGDPAAAQRWLEPIADHLLDAGLGQVSEIFDGDPPHRPGGCPAQAWSVACTLEAWWRLEHARRRSATASR